MSNAVAAIDCGSNSTRLLVSSGEGRALERDMRITRLSQGVDASGTLTLEAMERTFEVLATYRAVCDDLDVQKGLLVATSAVRDASNRATFLSRARDVVGFEARVLSGGEEATFSYAGATRDLDESRTPTMIVDVGGGSTELALKVRGELKSFSMQLGCVRVSERALGRGLVTPEGDSAARSMIRAELDRAFLAVPDFDRVVGHVRLIGLAGTVATLAQLDARLAVYDRDVVHHRLLSRAVVQDWRDRLARETPEERLAHPGMVVGREDVLTAGLYILDAVMDRFDVDQLLSSESDILDGIVSSLLLA
ncbi:MAG: exopolyphosphatase [Acidimicrobiaceae bacterium]|nr:exopolyphosphatase [Acidimicrobiaceae bacterium]